MEYARMNLGPRIDAAPIVTVFACREKAQAIADANNATEADGWHYDVKPVPRGFVVWVSDAAGQPVGAL